MNKPELKDAKAAFLAENRQSGEEYAGIIIGKDGEPDYHLFLRRGSASNVTWQQAKEWAESIGGELPTRREQALLLANLKECFESYYYWSCEQHESDSNTAWGQYFSYVYQDYWYKDNYYRACAVRRVVIK